MAGSSIMSELDQRGLDTFRYNESESPEERVLAWIDLLTRHNIEMAAEILRLKADVNIAKGRSGAGTQREPKYLRRKDTGAMRELIYVASPYSHDDYLVREERFRQATLEVAEMIRSGMLVISPICHSHPVAVGSLLPIDFDYWKLWNHELLRRCDKLVVMKLDGWEDSVGVAWEMEWAKDLGMPMEFLEVT